MTDCTAAGAAYHLRETKLREGKVLEDQADGLVLVKATVRDIGELRWWLLGFGDGLEVLQPAEVEAGFRLGSGFG